MRLFSLYSLGNQRMSATHSTTGKNCVWKDSFQFLIWEDQTQMTVLVGDHNATSEANNLFIYSQINLNEVFEQCDGASQNVERNFNLYQDGEVVGKIKLQFVFDRRELTAQENSYKHLDNMMHEWDYYYDQWEHHIKTCSFHHDFDWLKVAGDYHHHDHGELHTGLLKVCPMRANLSRLEDYSEKVQPFLVFTFGNQRMATSTNKKIGKDPKWRDVFHF